MGTLRNTLSIVGMIVGGVCGAIAVAWWWVGSAIDDAARSL